MRMLRVIAEKLSVLALLLVVPGAIAWGTGPYTQVFPSSSLSLGQEQGYDTVGLEDCGQMTEVGRPRLPVRYVNLIIPAGMSVDSVAIVAEVWEPVQGTYTIIPAQHPIPTDLNPPPPWVDPDSATYASASPIPGKLAEPVRHGYFDGANRVVTIALYPLQYVPLTGDLTLYTSITFDLNLSTSTDQPIYPAIRLRHLQTVYDNALIHLVDNPEDIGTYGYKPQLIDSMSFAPDDTVPDCPCIIPWPNCIITEDSLVGYFAEFVEWTTRKGIPSGVIPFSNISRFECCHISGDEVSEIYDEPGKIREYLRIGYLCCGTVFALLAGRSSGAFEEGDVLPARIAAGACHRVVDPPWPPDDRNMVPADLYFSDFNGDWNEDLDEYYGEVYGLGCEGDAVDYLPEMFVGRIPCSNGQEIQNWIEKILIYEQNPGEGDFSYLTRAYWAQADWGQAQGAAQSCQAYYPSHFSHDLTEEYPSFDDPAPTSPTGAQIISEMSQGYGMVNWNHHGNDVAALVRTRGNHTQGLRSWRVSTYDEYLGFEEPEDGNGLDNLTNTHEYFVLDAIECNNGAYDIANHYDKTSIAGGALFLSERGAVAFLGNTRVGYWGWSNAYRIECLKALFGYEGTPPVYYLGVCEAIAKPYGEHYLALSHNLFGSPAVPIWTDTPQELQVTVNYKDDYAWVRDESNQPVEGAAVCFSHDWAPYWVGTTSADGIAYCPFEIDPAHTYVVTTKPNFLPWRYEPRGVLIASDTTIQGTVHIEGDLIVDQGATLTLLPSTILLFATQDAYGSGFDQEKSELIVAGNLVAVGSETDSIRFVSESGAYDTWRGISVLSDGNAQLQYCLIQGASIGVDLQDTSADVIQLSRFHNNVCGIRSSNGNAQVSNNWIMCDNLGDYGIYLDCLVSYPPNEIAAQFNMILNYEYGIYAFNSETVIYGNQIYGCCSGSVIGLYCWNCDGVTAACNLICGDHSDCYVKALESTMHISHCTFEAWPEGGYVSRGIVYEHSDGYLRGNWVACYADVGVDCYDSDPDLGREDYAGDNAFFRTNLNTIDVRNVRQRGGEPKGPGPSPIAAIKNYWGGAGSPRAPFMVGDVDWEPSLWVMPDPPECSALPDSQPNKLAAGSHLRPREFGLFQNYPNPFNPQTEIRYALPADCHVNLTVYNILGQKVVTLIDEFQDLGKKTVLWDGRNEKGVEVSSGIYFYRIQAGNFSEARKMVVTK